MSFLEGLFFLELERMVRKKLGMANHMLTPLSFTFLIKMCLIGIKSDSQELRLQNYSIFHYLAKIGE